MKKRSIAYYHAIDKRLVVIHVKDGKAITKDRDKKYRVIPVEMLVPIE